MMRRGCYHLLLSALGLSVAGQLIPWSDNQINTTICTWEQPRAALLRDTVYLDGGNLWWSPGLADGRLGTPIDSGNPGGLIFKYNLSIPFDAETNVSGILLGDTLSKARGGTGNSNGAAPDFYDGAMLANDAQFYMYGGSVFQNLELYDNPDADFVLGYQAYQYGPDKAAWKPSFDDTALDKDVNRFITYGGAANAPSENKAWYFSGMTSPSRGEITTNPNLNGSTTAQNVSDTLILLDMKVQFSEEWINKTLPNDVKGRANPEIVWVPVGEQGILVVLGGVVYPEWVTLTRKSEDADASEKESPIFMQEIDIYDIANDKWYKQPTEGGPGTRTRGCAVVAPALDYSSFNIYYYGGFDGINLKDAFYDDVWVLSLPSFTWTQLNKGTDLHARAGHKCFMPYSDQMMAFGGYTPLGGTGMGCLQNGPLIILNLTSGEWMDSYHPDKHFSYGVPSKVREAIGGDASGGATITTPAPSGWATDALEDVFGTSYDKDKIKTWGPYNAVDSSSNRPKLPNGEGKNNDGGLPSWVAPVLGVVLGLMLVTGAIVIFCLWRRRKIFKGRSSEAGTEDAGKRILSWMMRSQATDKAPTVTTSEDTPASPEMTVVKPVEPTPVDDPVLCHEAASTPIAELDNTSTPAELSDTGLSPIDILNSYSHFANDKSRSMSNPSYLASSLIGGASDIHSTVSRSTGAGHSAPHDESRPGSPSLPNTPEPDYGGHMRSLSETLASTRPPVGRRATDQVLETPVSPPTPGDVPGDDYNSARAALVSPLRRSVFHESEDDLGSSSISSSRQ